MGSCGFQSHLHARLVLLAAQSVRFQSAIVSPHLTSCSLEGDEWKNTDTVADCDGMGGGMIPLASAAATVTQLLSIWFLPPRLAVHVLILLVFLALVLGLLLRFLVLPFLLGSSVCGSFTFTYTRRIINFNPQRYFQPLVPSSCMVTCTLGSHANVAYAFHVDSCNMAGFLYLELFMASLNSPSDCIKKWKDARCLCLYLSPSPRAEMLLWRHRWFDPLTGGFGFEECALISRS